MNRVKSVRTAAAVSLILIGLWFFLTAAGYIFQPAVLEIFGYSGSLPESRIIPASCFTGVTMAVITAAAGVMLYRGSGRYSPLVISAVTAGIYPAVSRIAGTVQMIQVSYDAVYGGAEMLAAYSVCNNFMNTAGFLLSAASTIVIAAGAVNAYAKNRECGTGFGGGISRIS